MTRIDARGLKCPWPALRLGRALRDHPLPIEIRADDPAAARELTALALARGLSIECVESDIYRVSNAAV